LREESPEWWQKRWRPITMSWRKSRSRPPSTLRGSAAFWTRGSCPGFELLPCRRSVMRKYEALEPDTRERIGDYEVHFDRTLRMCCASAPASGNSQPIRLGTYG